MNEIVNKVLLAEEKVMPEMQFRQPGFTYSACGPFTKNKETIQKLKGKRIQDKVIETKWTKFAFSMTRLLEISKIYLEEQLLRKYCVTKCFILRKIRKTMDVKEVLFQ